MGNANLKKINESKIPEFITRKILKCLIPPVYQQAKVTLKKKTWNMVFIPGKKGSYYYFLECFRFLNGRPIK